MKIVEWRPLVKLYQKTEACRSEWVLMNEFHKIESKYIPVKYVTPQNSKYSQDWYWVRYIKKDDILSYK